MTATCPYSPEDGARPPERDDRKSAELVSRKLVVGPEARVIGGFGLVRELLRSNLTRQAGVGADGEVVPDPTYTSVFFLDGDAHKRKRQAISQFFTPKAISTRYRVVMEETSDQLLGRLQAKGRGRLDEMSFELAVTVAAQIVGLTESDQSAMAKRIQATLVGVRLPQMAWWQKPFGRVLTLAHGLRFQILDVGPAVKARRAEPRIDVISQLIEEGYSEQGILIECLTYAVAGMVTTREFIVMAAWHLFENDPLRERFLQAGEAEQIAILEEIMRIDPVVNVIARRTTSDADLADGSVEQGELLVLNLREANVDQAMVGECPHMLDPDRAKRRKINSYLSFGDGAHRCPGAQIALNETRVFLDRLLRVPGIRLQRRPDLDWTAELLSYELRNAVVVCDRP
ncbi:cytochrome P450 [Kineosporia rhizophila]|uniref:cytochrome P450 n=1 Tax=Kineosporia rhizophila TaxID=84633 RepID=UPI001E476E48|nr:cytochrome P450 [Kineosporia rhizophila]MCE0537493.1 cytochrome P450 [Kineosporia rhizophila]